jgi:large subunit ribosomal protein L22
MRATLSNYTQPPRKTRLITELVRGKGVAEALTLLKFDPKRAADPIAKLIASAAANAENQGEKASDLFIKSITVDKGLVTTRHMPRAFGRAAPINRRRSHVTVVLAKREMAPPKKRVVKKKK